MVGPPFVYLSARQSLSPLFLSICLDFCVPIFVPRLSLQVPIRDLRRLTVLGAAAVNGQAQVMRYLVNKKVCRSQQMQNVLAQASVGTRMVTEVEVSSHEVVLLMSS